jgi:hypothetical protein
MDDHHLGYIKKFLKEHSVTEQIYLGATWFIKAWENTLLQQQQSQGRNFREGRAEEEEEEE